MGSSSFLSQAVILIAGGAGYFGSAVARRLIRHSRAVILLDKNVPTGSSLAEKLGQSCLFIETDIAEADSVRAALDSVKTRFGGLDVMVNCSGAQRSFTRRLYNFISNSSPIRQEEIDQLFYNDVSGAHNLTTLGARLIAENQPDAASGQRGVIVQTTGIFATDGDQMQTVMSAALGALESMTLPLARQLARSGIRYVSLAPGLFDTDHITRSTLSDEFHQYLIDMIPFPARFGKAAEYAHLVQTVIENSYLNGCRIRIDGAHRSHLLG